nr:hypothetical protein [Ottowia sp.]
MIQDLLGQGAEALRGLIDATRFGGAYDALPCRLDGPQWEGLAPYLEPYPVTAGQMPIRQG